MSDFCTYFDRNYLYRGLAMYFSLLRNMENFRLHVLCLDDVCYDFVVRANMVNINPVKLVDLEYYDDELAASRARRTKVEYYFTLTPALPLFILNNHPEIKIITYLDSDLYFFKDPSFLIDEMKDDSILIIEHRFSEEGRFREEFGKYNVGWVSWRNDDNGRACLNWYRLKCLEWCFDAPEPTRYADQKYLDVWPDIFRGVQVLKHKGCNLAPWNVGNYTYSINGDDFMVDTVSLIFYHFHALENIFNFDRNNTGIAQYEPNLNSDDFDLLCSQVYEPYVEKLREIKTFVEEMGFPIGEQPRTFRHIDTLPASLSLPPWRDEMDWSLLGESGEEFDWSSNQELEEKKYSPPLRSGQTPLNPGLVVSSSGGEQRLVLECAIAETSRICKSAMSIFDWGGVLITTPARVSALNCFERKIRRYNVAEIRPAQLAPPNLKLEMEVLELAEGLALGSEVVSAGNCLAETLDWRSALIQLANADPHVLLLDVHIITGRPTFAVARRLGGEPKRRPIWVYNRGELGDILEDLGFSLRREWVRTDSAQIPGVREPVDSRIILLEKPRKKNGHRPIKMSVAHGELLSK